MVVELDRKDLAMLLAGTEVPLEMEDELLGKRLGWFDNKFVWNRIEIINSDLTDEEIFELYKRVVNYAFF